MRIAVAQIDTRAGDFEATLAKMGNCDLMARAYGVDLLVFPAPVLMGCDPMALAERPSYVADATLALGRLAETIRTTAIVPFVAGLAATPSPDAVLVRGGRVEPVSLNGILSALASLGMDDGQDGMPPFAPLSTPPVLDIDNVDVGLAFSYDDLDSFAAGNVQADVICFIPFDSFSTDDEATCMAPSVSDGCFVQDAADANAWIVAANAVGGWEDQVFVGGSFVMAPWGELAAVAHGFTDDFLVCDIDVLSEGPLADPVDPPFYDRSRILWDAAALATRDQVNKRDLDGIVVVADGTLSSCAAVALATDAVGPLRVHALVCAQGEALADARQVVRSLRIRDVDELSWADLERAAETLGGEGSQRLAAGLVQARLGAWAQEANLLALSSADKTALAVGASDDEPAAVCQAASFAPLGDVYRSDVARIARHRNTVSPVIPAGALTRFCVPAGLGLEELAASDELRLSELDAALLLHVERGADLGELAATRWGEERVGHLLERMDRMSAYRRGGILYPLLSSRGLVEDEAPLTDAWRDHARDEFQELFGPDGLAGDFAASNGRPRSQGEEEVPEAVSEYAHLLYESFERGLGEDDGDEEDEEFNRRLYEAFNAAYDAVAEESAKARDAARNEVPPREAHRSAATSAGDAGGTPKVDLRSQISEAMGYLQELSDGSRMRGGRGDKGKGEDIWRGYFSDN